ncbi:hypothetical protein RI367_000398 [Sorochytrium milnesiophthora]
MDMNDQEQQHSIAGAIATLSRAADQHRSQHPDASLHSSHTDICESTAEALVRNSSLHIMTSAPGARRRAANVRPDVRFQAPMRFFAHQSHFAATAATSLGKWSPCWIEVCAHKVYIYESIPARQDVDHSPTSPIEEPLVLDLYRAKCAFNLTMKEQGSAAYHWIVHTADGDLPEQPTPLIQQDFLGDPQYTSGVAGRRGTMATIHSNRNSIVVSALASPQNFELAAEFQINTEDELVKLISVLRQVREENYQACVLRLCSKRTQDTKEHAATLIQTQWRRHSQQEKYAVFRHAVVCLQSHFRRRQAKKLYDKLKLDYKKLAVKDHRNRVVYEIAATEESYVEQLDILIRVYLRPLRSLFHETHRSLPRAQIDRIFGNVEEIHARHEDFLSKLKVVTDVWDESGGCLGELFLSMSQWLNVYIPYCNNWDVAKEVLAKSRKVSLFSEFLESVRSLRISKKNDITSFLILPIQRYVAATLRNSIPRYELLLKDLIRHTWPNHPDLPMLHAALAKITACAKLLNRAKMYHDNKDKIEQLAKKLRKGTSLRDEFRTYLGEGRAVYREPGSIRTHNVYLFLFTDQLLVTLMKQERKFMASSASPHAVKFEHLVNIPLDTVTVCDRELISAEVRSNASPGPSPRSSLGSVNANIATAVSTALVNTLVKKEYTVSLIVTGQLLRKDQEHLLMFESADLKVKWLSDIREAMEELEKLKAADSDITGFLSVGDDDELPASTMCLNGVGQGHGVQMRKRYASVEILASARIGSTQALNEPARSAPMSPYAKSGLAPDLVSSEARERRRSLDGFTKSDDSDLEPSKLKKATHKHQQANDSDTSPKKAAAKVKQRSVGNLLSLFS